MVQSLNNQVVLGKREWLILTDNNKPKPVGEDGQPLSDKPLKKELREPSQVDEESDNDENVIGFMGDDEDIQQAQYNVMSLIENKIGGLDNEIGRITRELDILVQRNRDDIDDLKKTGGCITFLHNKCGEEKTYEGCSACATYYHEQGELPEDCLGDKSQLVQNFCTYSSPNYATAGEGKSNEIRPHLDFATYPGEKKIEEKCRDLGHFDCSSIITQNSNLFQRSADKLCLWDTSSLTNYAGKNDDNDNDVNLKCRNFCFTYKDENECKKSDSCTWYEKEGEEGQCLENLCENRQSYEECTNNYGKENKNDLCGVSLKDDPDKSYLTKWRKWVGIETNLPDFGEDGNPICLMRNGKEKKMKDGTENYYEGQGRDNYCKSDIDQSKRGDPGGIRDRMYEGKLKHGDWDSGPFGIVGTFNFSRDFSINTVYDVLSNSSPPNVPYCRTAKNVGKDKIKVGETELGQLYHCRRKTDPEDNISYYYDTTNVNEEDRDRIDPCIDGSDGASDIYSSSPGDTPEQRGTPERNDGRNKIDRVTNLRCRENSPLSEAQYIQGNYKDAASICEDKGTCYYGYNIFRKPGSEYGFIPSPSPSETERPGCFSFPNEDGGKDKLTGGKQFFSAHSKYCSSSPPSGKRGRCLEDHCRKYENDENICNNIEYDEDIINDNNTFSKSVGFKFLPHNNICKLNSGDENECASNFSGNQTLNENIATYKKFVENFNKIVDRKKDLYTGLDFFEPGLRVSISAIIGCFVYFLVAVLKQYDIWEFGTGSAWEIPVLRDIDWRDFALCAVFIAASGIFEDLRWGVRDEQNTGLNPITHPFIDNTTRLNTQMKDIRQIFTDIKGTNGNLQSQIDVITNMKKFYEKNTEKKNWSIDTIAKIEDIYESNDINDMFDKYSDKSSRVLYTIIGASFAFLLLLFFNLVTSSNRLVGNDNNNVRKNTIQLFITIFLVSLCVFFAIYYSLIFIGKNLETEVDEAAVKTEMDNKTKEYYSIPLDYNDTLGIPSGKQANLNEIYFCGQPTISSPDDEKIKTEILEYNLDPNSNKNFDKLYIYTDPDEKTYKGKMWWYNIAAIIIFMLFLVYGGIFMNKYYVASETVRFAMMPAADGGRGENIGQASRRGQAIINNARGIPDGSWFGLVDNKVFIVLGIFIAVALIICTIFLIVYIGRLSSEGKAGLILNTGEKDEDGDNVLFDGFETVKEIVEEGTFTLDASPSNFYSRIAGIKYTSASESGGDCKRQGGFCKTNSFSRDMAGNIPSGDWKLSSSLCINQDDWEEKVNKLNITDPEEKKLYLYQPILNTLIKNNSDDNYFHEEVLRDPGLIQYIDDLHEYLSNLRKVWYPTLIPGIIFIVVFGGALCFLEVPYLSVFCIILGVSLLVFSINFGFEIENVKTLEKDIYNIIKTRYDYWKGDKKCTAKEECYIHIDKNNKRDITKIELNQTGDILEYECNKLGGCTSSQLTQPGKFSVCLDNGFTKDGVDDYLSSNPIDKKFESPDCVLNKEIFDKAEKPGYPGVYTDVVGWPEVTEGTPGLPGTGSRSTIKMGNYLDSAKIKLKRDYVPFSGENLWFSWGFTAISILALLVLFGFSLQLDGNNDVGKFVGISLFASLIIGIYLVVFTYNFIQESFHSDEYNSIPIGKDPFLGGKDEDGENEHDATSDDKFAEFHDNWGHWLWSSVVVVVGFFLVLAVFISSQ